MIGYENATLQERVERRRKIYRNKRRKKVFYSVLIVLLVAVIAVSAFYTVKALSMRYPNKNIDYNTLDIIGVNGMLYGIRENCSGIMAEELAAEASETERMIRKALYGVKVDPAKPMIALTFDDGPSSRYTKRVLDALEKVGGRATFFVLGEMISGNEELLKRASELGCEIGNHSYSHKNFVKIDEIEIKNELNRTNDLIHKAVGMPAALTRVPYGELDNKVRSAVQTPIIQWSIDTLDWKSRNKQAVLKVVYNNLHDGDVILMHDIYESSVSAAEELIANLVSRGYQLVTVSELMEAREIEMTAGKAYSQAYK